MAEWERQRDELWDAIDAGYVLCPKCNGNRWEANRVECSLCYGTGTVTEREAQDYERENR